MTQTQKAAKTKKVFRNWWYRDESADESRRQDAQENDEAVGASAEMLAVLLVWREKPKPHSIKQA